MGSWVLHAAGLSVEELSRNQVQLLGLGCKPTDLKVNPGAPPPGTVVDASGEWWELGDRARNIDSASRLDKRALSAATPTDTSKFQLSLVNTSGEAGGRTLLLPDYVEVCGRMDDAKAICASGGPPGLPLRAAKAAANPSKRSGGVGRQKRADTQSKIETKVQDAYSAVAQRKMRSTDSEYFCVMVPCCRVYLGQGSHDEWPAVEPKQWPRFISSVVLGGRVDGEIQNQLKVGLQEGKKKARATSVKNLDRVTWSTSMGERMSLDFHGGATVRCPKPKKGQISTVQDLLAHLDTRWVKKARLFPETWSLLWVETIDTQFVLSELRGDGIQKSCPYCSSQLLFGAVEDRDEEVQSTPSDDEESVNGMQRSHSGSSSGSSHHDPEFLKISKNTEPKKAGIRCSESQLAARRATKAVKRLLQNSALVGPDFSVLGIFQTGDNEIQDAAPLSNQSYGDSNPSADLTGSRREQMNLQGRDSTVSSFSVSQMSTIAGSSDAGEDFPGSPSAAPSPFPGTPRGPGKGLTSASSEKCMIDAWAKGSVPCVRCHRENAVHALICPKFDAHHSFFKPLCLECRNALECVFDMLNREREAERLCEHEEGGHGANDAHSPKPEPIACRFNAPARPAFATDTGVLLPGKEECVAIELELRICIETVHNSRHQLLLDELRDELHRALQVPLRQIFVLQDGGSRRGVFQIGILHPQLVPSQVQRLHHQRKQENGNEEEEEEVDLEVLDAATDLDKTWDRLVMFLYGGAAQHRCGIGNGFPLLRSRRRDFNALRWRSATTVALATREHLIEIMHDSKGDEDGPNEAETSGEDDNVGGGAHAAFHDQAGGDDSSSAAKDKKKAALASKNARRQSQSPRRPSSFMMVPPESPKTPQGGATPLCKIVETPSPLLPAHSQPVSSACSRLRPSDLHELLSTLPEVANYNPDVIVEHTWRKQFAEQCWTQDAQELAVLPHLSEVNMVHMPALHSLAWSNDLQGLMVALNRAKPSSLNSVDRMGRTPLHLAAARCSVECLSLFTSLVEPNGPIKFDLCDVNGRAAIHYAAFRGDAAIMSCFIDVLQPRALDILDTLTGDSSVLIASRLMHEDVVRCLILAAATPNTANKRGLTPLHVAAAAGSTTCCSLLIEARAALEALDALDRSPLEWSKIYKNVAVSELLQHHKKHPHLAASKNLATPSSVAENASQLRAPPLPARTRAYTGDSDAASDSQDFGSPKWHPQSPSRPKTTRAPWRRPIQMTKGSPEVRPATAPEPLQSTPLCASLLEGGRVPQENLTNLGMDGWTGNAGSLAVRWRSWAQVAFPKQQRAVEPNKPAAKGKRTARKKITRSGTGFSGKQIGKSEKEKVMVPQAPDNPTRDQVADTAESLGGFFCTTCWEYVLRGHPAH